MSLFLPDGLEQEMERVQLAERRAQEAFEERERSQPIPCPCAHCGEMIDLCQVDGSFYHEVSRKVLCAHGAQPVPYWRS